MRENILICDVCGYKNPVVNKSYDNCDEILIREQLDDNWPELKKNIAGKLLRNRAYAGIIKRMISLKIFFGGICCG